MKKSNAFNNVAETFIKLDREDNYAFLIYTLQELHLDCKCLVLRAEHNQARVLTTDDNTFYASNETDHVDLGIPKQVVCLGTTIKMIDDYVVTVEEFGTVPFTRLDGGEGYQTIPNNSVVLNHISDFNFTTVEYGVMGDNLSLLYEDDADTALVDLLLESSASGKVVNIYDENGHQYLLSNEGFSFFREKDGIKEAIEDINPVVVYSDTVKVIGKYLVLMEKHNSFISTFSYDIVEQSSNYIKLSLTKDNITELIGLYLSARKHLEFELLSSDYDNIKLHSADGTLLKRNGCYGFTKESGPLAGISFILDEGIYFDRERSSGSCETNFDIGFNLFKFHLNEILITVTDTGKGLQIMVN